MCTGRACANSVIAAWLRADFVILSYLACKLFRKSFFNAFRKSFSKLAI